MNRELYQQALDTFGCRHQQDKCWEEFGEFAEALYEYEWEGASYQRVLEELADVIIMLEQMAMWMGIAVPERDAPQKPIILALAALQIQYLHLMDGRANECTVIDALHIAWNAAERKAQEAPLLVAEYKATKLKRLEWRVNKARKLEEGVT